MATLATIASMASIATMATVATSLPLVGLFYACQRAPAAPGSSAKLPKLERFGKFKHVAIPSCIMHVNRPKDAHMFLREKKQTGRFGSLVGTRLALPVLKNLLLFRR